jgi:hypothetical protein
VLKTSKHTQLVVGALLLALMIMTRGSHFPQLNLPSASWAVFFLVGVLLRPVWAYPLFFAAAVAVDVLTVGWANVGHHCMTIAYWALLPGYAALWLGGRLYAGWHREQASSLLVLVPTMMVSALVCQVFTSGGFYWFSGRYAEPTFVGMIERLAHYYPSYLSTMAAYVAVAVVLYVGARSAAALFGNASQRA